MDLSTFEFIAAAGTVLVLIGVVSEGAEILIKISKVSRARRWIEREGSRRWLFSFLWLTRKLHPIMLWIEGVGLGIVVVGLAIEWFGTSGAERIQSDKNAELVSANTNLTLRIEELRSSNLGLQIELASLQTQETAMATNINDLQLMNLPVMEITGSATFRVMLSNIPQNIPKNALLTLIGNGIGDVELETHDITLATNQLSMGGLCAQMHFSLPDSIKNIRLNKRASMIADVASMRIVFNDFTLGNAIGPGFATLRINNIPKIFRIRPQAIKPSGMDPPFSWSIFATNGMF